MSATATASSSGGIGFVGLLTIVFIVLKLTGIIAWEWIWVLSPLWIGFGIWLIVVAIAFGLIFWIAGRAEKRGY